MTAPPPKSVVIDASAVVALLADAGPAGRWVTATISGAALAAPHLLPFEVGNILRRHALAGLLDQSASALAHADLLALPVDLYPYEVVAGRVWQMRNNLTIYDGSYVALAELLGAPLVTLDARIARAPGGHCRVITQ